MNTKYSHLSKLGFTGAMPGDVPVRAAPCQGVLPGGACSWPGRGCGHAFLHISPGIQYRQHMVAVQQIFPRMNQETQNFKDPKKII